MPTYLSPGVYVEEIASGSAPIAGAGTSTAAIIGIISEGPWIIRQLGSQENLIEIGTGTDDSKTYKWTEKNDVVGINYTGQDDQNTKFVYNNTDNKRIDLVIEGEIGFNPETKEATVNFTNPVPTGAKITGYYQVKVPADAKECSIKLCTNFGEFKQTFGDFSAIEGQKILAHAVYGFFNNGGTRCYVTWIKGKAKIDTVLQSLEAIDEISIVVAPGHPDIGDNIRTHCQKMGDRIAVLDGEKVVDLTKPEEIKKLKPFTSNYAALYFPWIQVYDPASKGNIYVPPSGHIAGIYARVDGQRGVHKAPANEPIFGALDLEYNLSKAQQDGLNPDGINCIRRLNGNILVWGARTLGGDANGEFKYVNIRRYFLYLRDSIDKGTQWVVFEPHTPELWAKIRRNISAFLLLEWRKGALFGTSPEQAFFVKCDEETNPPEIRERGQLVTEIGVAIVQPAEFVIFRLSQWTAQ